MPAALRCASDGCGFSVTGVCPAHCCHACRRSASRHGPACQRAAAPPDAPAAVPPPPLCAAAPADGALLMLRAGAREHGPYRAARTADGTALVFNAFPQEEEGADVAAAGVKRRALQCRQDGVVNEAGVGMGGAWQQWHAHDAGDGLLSLSPAGHAAKGWRLVSGDAGLRAAAAGSGAEGERFACRAVTEEEARGLAEHRGVCVAEYAPSAALSAEQLRAFALDGYLHLPGAVPRRLVDDALAAINHQLCTGGAANIPDDDGKLTFPAKLRSDPRLLRLVLSSSVWTAVQSLMGEGNVVRPNGCQIALRPPEPGLYGKELPAVTPPRQWHIDGQQEDRRERLFSPFSLLCGVTLTDCAAPNNGNFCVFPGSHHVLLPRVEQCVQRGDKMFGDQDNDAKPELLPGGTQVLARAGDCVVAHQKLAHRGGPNAGAHIRYQLYFRLRHVNHEEHVRSGAILDDLWVEFEPVRRHASDVGGASPPGASPY